MGKHLAEELVRYYAEVGNQTRFRNGMSLNKLAFEMYARLDFRGMEPSVLSRIIKGAREFTPPQLDIFCDIVGLTEAERWDLKEALNEDYILKHGLEFDLAASPKDIERFEAYSRGIYEMRIAGVPRNAIGMADNLLGWLQEKREQASSVASIQRLLRIQAEVLYEQATAYKSLTPLADTVNVVWPFYAQMCALAKESNFNKEIYGMANILLGDAYYIAGDYRESLHLLSDILEQVNDAHYRLSLLRTMALNYAYLNEETLFTSAEHKLRTTIQRGDLVHKEYVSAVFEGIARGQGLLNQQKAFQTIEEGRLYTSAPKESEDSLLRVQYLRSQVELLRRLEPTERREIEDKGKQGLQLATIFGFQKYVNVFTALLTPLEEASDRKARFQANHRSS